MTLDGALEVAVTDGRVACTFTVTNAGTEPVDLRFRSGQIAEVTVSGDGDVVWRWSDGRLFTQALKTISLDAGERLTHEAVWEGPKPGTYTARAALQATDATVVDVREFTVPAP
ncbi:BsuPI-related putative proteinase inhibitor [Halorubrum sp. DTA98]|uniref:BsuPI-related putative proteinase inhibitor n=1 Tax=Halorubrum sp. DTA98 TaxID=3402163 RepID=UPI003AAA3ABE